MDQKVGLGSLRFKETPFILGAASIVGTKEGDGPLGDYFDMVSNDDRFGENTWETAESTLQKEVLALAMGKSKVDKKDIRYLFAGDLLGQSMATYFGLKGYDIPLFVVYGACSTCGESLALASMTVAGGFADCVATVTSSHFGSAEKQFRFPLEYANQRPVSSTWTVTGGGAYLLSNEEFAGKRQKIAKITGITTGTVVDYGVKDSMNMGAAMAPAAAELIVRHLKDFCATPENYDRIITGDLGKVGSGILIDLLEKEGIRIKGRHQDCGCLIYEDDRQNTGSGGSGCGCSASVLSAYFLPMLQSGKLKKILFIPTGALISPVSFNEGNSVPGIAHGIVIESV